MTCFLTVLDHDECVTLVSVEPRHAVASVAQRPGTRHAVTVGAPGKAILSLLPRRAWPAGVSGRLEELVADAAARGWFDSHDEVIPTLRSVAVPLALRSRGPAAIAVVYVATAHEPSEIGARLSDSAAVIRGALGA
jgi:DNA-binding IclR family transcriptional regulator